MAGFIVERGRYEPIITGIRTKGDAARAATAIGVRLKDSGYAKAYISRVVAREAAHAFDDPRRMEEGDGTMGVRLDQQGIVRGLYYQPEGERTILEQLTIVCGPEARGLGFSKSDRKKMHCSHGPWGRMEVVRPMISLDTIFLSCMLLALQGVVLAEVVVLRERPILVPIVVFGAFAVLIVGVTLMALGAVKQALPWLAPIAVLMIAYTIHRLYEGWGI